MPLDADAMVIGAGIVGATIAFALRRDGQSVLLVDRDAPGRGCSYGNAGAISAGSVAPLAMPGIWRAAPGMLADPAGPLYLPLSYVPRALPWLAAFVASARASRVEHAARALYALQGDAVARHRELVHAIGAPELLLEAGHLHLYPDEAALARDAAAWSLRKRHGIACERLDRDGILALEPAIGERYRVAMYLPDHGTIVNPYRYVTRIAEAFASAGGHVAQHDVRLLTPERAAWRVHGEGRAWTVRRVVVAAGAWSNALLAPLGATLPLESQRGYHATFDGVRGVIARTVVLSDRKAFMAPMEGGLRIAGTVEFGGLARPPDWRRAELLAEFARATLPGLLASASTSMWMGHRPCVPDSLPRIGAVPGHSGLFVATGHGHLGLTQAPATAARVIEWLHGTASRELAA